MLVLDVNQLRRMPKAQRDAAALTAVQVAMKTPSREVRRQQCAAYVALIQAGATPQRNGEMLLRGEKAVGAFLGDRDPVVKAELCEEYLSGKLNPSIN